MGLICWSIVLEEQVKYASLVKGSCLLKVSHFLPSIKHAIVEVHLLPDSEFHQGRKWTSYKIPSRFHYSPQFTDVNPGPLVGGVT